MYYGSTPGTAALSCSYAAISTIMAESYGTIKSREVPTLRSTRCRYSLLRLARVVVFAGARVLPVVAEPPARFDVARALPLAGFDVARALPFGPFAVALPLVAILAA